VPACLKTLSNSSLLLTVISSEHSATALFGTSYIGLINAVLQKLENIQEVIYDIATMPGGGAKIFIERWEEIIFKINPNFVALFIVVCIVVVVVPISGIIVCCCKICDRIDKLKTIHEVLLGWRIYYIILLACCNGILIERVTRLAIANHNLDQSSRQLGPTFHTAVKNGTRYFVGFGLKTRYIFS